jgi:hypothetical protein
MLAAQFASPGYRRCSLRKGALACQIPTDREARQFALRTPVSAGRDRYLRLLDRGFDLPREVQLFALRPVRLLV